MHLFHLVLNFYREMSFGFFSFFFFAPPNRNVKREVKGLAGLEHENIVRYYCSWKGYDHVTYPDSR